METKFKLISTSRFKVFEEELTIYINNFIDNLLAFFNIKEYQKPTIHLYNDKEIFKKVSRAPYELGPLGGCFDYFGVKVYIDLDKLSKEKLYTCISHELTHWFYQKYIQEKGIQNRVVWFDEGLATNLSGEHQDLIESTNLENYLQRNIYDQNKIIPDISYLTKHGNKFGEFVDTETKKYSGYVWSYLMIRYLIEVLPKEKLDKIMRSKKEIDLIGENLPKETYDYYKKKIKVNRRSWNNEFIHIQT